jgi:S1-C subfamily serine protease
MPRVLTSKISAGFLALLILFPTVLMAQQPPAANPPPSNEGEDVELNTALMESTFMIQGPTVQGPMLGTVFVVGRPIPNSNPLRGVLVLVTAAHVLEQIQGDIAVLNLRKKVDEKTNSWVRVPLPLKIRANGKPLWTRHPEADVAVMYLSIPPDAPITPIVAITPLMFADDEKLTNYEVKPGDELRCLGYPLGNASNDAWFPILRSGRIASYPLLPTDKTKTFLLDLRVFKGNSGGPVFFVERMRPMPHTLGGFTNYHFIMGLVSEEIVYPEQSGGQYSQEIHLTQLGLAKVVHASLVKQTIEMLPPPQPELQTPHP